MVLTIESHNHKLLESLSRTTTYWGGVTRLTEEKTGIGISDSVVMGDVQQNILKIGECPSCSASGGVTVMKCQNKECTSIKFCNSCHRNCRYSEGTTRRFDSGAGSGPFCIGCLTAKLTQFDLEKLEQERLAREAKDEQERLKQERRHKRKIQLELRKTKAFRLAIISYFGFVLIWMGAWNVLSLIQGYDLELVLVVVPSTMCCAPFSSFLFWIWLEEYYTFTGGIILRAE